MELERLNEVILKNHTDYETMEKGRVYYSSGLVKHRVVVDDSLTGTVYGNHRVYYPIVKMGRDSLEFKCTCGKGEMCKHVVALVLSWIYERNTFRSLDNLLNDMDRTYVFKVIKRAVKQIPGFLEHLLEK